MTAPLGTTACASSSCVVCDVLFVTGLITVIVANHLIEETSKLGVVVDSHGITA